jgi:hypothetical protein
MPQLLGGHDLRQALSFGFFCHYDARLAFRATFNCSIELVVSMTARRPRELRWT